MAPKKASSKGSTRGQDFREVAPPDGFEEITPARAGRAWFRKVVGAVIQGTLMGKVERHGDRGKGYYYPITVSHTVQAMTKEDDAGPGEYESVEVEPGTVVNVDEVYGMTCLRPYAESPYRGKVEVHLSFPAKREIPGGKTVWECRVHVKLPRGMAHPIPVADSDVPF